MLSVCHRLTLHLTNGRISEMPSQERVTTMENSQMNDVFFEFSEFFRISRMLLISFVFFLFRLDNSWFRKAILSDLIGQKLKKNRAKLVFFAYFQSYYSRILIFANPERPGHPSSCSEIRFFLRCVLTLHFLLCHLTENYYLEKNYLCTVPVLKKLFSVLKTGYIL